MRTAILGGLLAGVPSGAFVGAFYSDNVTESVIAGILFCITATAGVAAYIAWRERRWERWVAKTCSELETEGIVPRGPARMPNRSAARVAAFLGGSVLLAERGGLLVLTKQRLVFVPHRHNFLGVRGELSVTDIVGVRSRRGLLSNAIVLVTRDKQCVEIEVRDRATWLAKLPGAKVPS